MKKISTIALFVGIGALMLAGCRSAPASAPPAAAALPEPAPPPAPVADVPAAAPPVEARPAAPRPEPVVKGIILDDAGSYTVVKGDTLADISAAKYGGSNMYFFPLIRLANGAVTDPDEIEVGTKLVIPGLQRNLDNAGARAAIREDMLSVADHYQRQGKPKAAAKLKALAARLAR